MQNILCIFLLKSIIKTWIKRLCKQLALSFQTIKKNYTSSFANKRDNYYIWHTILSYRGKYY